MTTPIKPPTAKPPTDTELAKQLANSLLRDLFAAASMAGIRAAYTEDACAMDYDCAAATAFRQADRMMACSHTPKIIEQLKNL